jgi:membrane protease YdiL (CAAX protease family)
VELAVAVAGFVAEAGAWWSVRARRAHLWRLLPIVLVAMAVAAVLVRPPVAASDVGAGNALAVGAVSGLVLYLATRVFVAIASRWAPFRRAIVDIYAEAQPIAIGAAIVLSVAVMVPAEELFWRGLVQAGLDDLWGPAAAAVITWLAYIAVNVPSRSLPIMLGAAVGGAVWAALAWWSGGMLASLASHILWTGSMLALPPAPGREVVGP